MYKFLVLVLVLCVEALVSCGYRFQGSGSILPDDIRTVAIAPVENETTVSGLGPELGEALRSEFERYGVVTVVEDASLADAVLEAKVLSVGTSVKNVTGSTDIELDAEIMLTIGAQLERRNGQVLWRNNRLSASQSIASVSDVVVTSSSQFLEGGIGAGSLASLEDRELSRGQQRQAISDLTEEISRKVYLEAVAEDF
ncbi:MAG: hypothetical protein IT291_09885 [Deltaproteobacteria bacterium]|nr:hypothetical protein [Deltaproteobacteria bacterium]